MLRLPLSRLPLCPAPRVTAAAPLTLLLLALFQAACPSSEPATDNGAPEASGPCDPSSCAGCCQGQLCQVGNVAEACGAGGLPCVVCQDKEVCTLGHCIAEGAKCTPLTCPKGCCQDDECQQGTSTEACGKGGQACATCSSTQTCEGQACACSAGACKGCCEGNTCRPGTIAAACGTGGQPCKKCGTSEGCVAGTCVSGATCSAATCPGCCEGTVCKLGNLKEACGLNGAACQVCGANEACTLGICNDSQSCGPSTCASGCCQASKCQAGTTSAACGKGGGLCTTCGKPKTCQAGGCVLDAASVWGVTVITAQISTAKTWDWPFYTAPDPYVVIEVGGQKGNTSAKNDTYAPEWNELLFSATAGTLISNPLKVSVYDDDLANDQLMGQCEVTVPEAVLLGGGGVVPSCGPEVLSIELKFNLQ